jgi:hypothetical protein
MSDGLRVDLSALDEVVSKLRWLLNEMGSVETKAKYSTAIPAGAFGAAGDTDAETGDTLDFREAGELHSAHSEMKVNLERIINKLNGIIDKFGTDTGRVRDKYSNQELATKQTMGGGSQNAGPASNKGVLA